MKKDDCIFCRIAAGEISSDTVYEDDDFRVILDLNPGSRGHMLIIPKEHYQDIYELSDECGMKLMAVAKKMAVAAKKALKADGINLVQNNEEAAGQSVPHFHMHVIPRYKDETERIVCWNPKSSDPDEQAAIAEAIRSELG